MAQRWQVQAKIFCYCLSREAPHNAIVQLRSLSPAVAAAADAAVMAALWDCQMLDSCSQVASDREVDCTSFTRRDACRQAGARTTGCLSTTAVSTAEGTVFEICMRWAGCVCSPVWLPPLLLWMQHHQQLLHLLQQQEGPAAWHRRCCCCW
jgi:hypothetical protein